MKHKLICIFSLISIYLSSGLIAGRAYAQDRCLMVLDVQKFDKHDKQQEIAVQEMIRNVNVMISRFPPEKVIYIKSAGKALNISLKGISTVMLPAPDFDNALKVVGNHTFNKTEGDAFTSTELQHFLKNNEIREIVLTGLMADKCVYHTALGGKSRGYNIMIAPEGIVGTTQKKKEKAIARLKGKGIQIISMAGVTPAP